MPLVASLLLALAVATPPDTTVVLARTERDLTGDKQPQVLKVVGVGSTIDSLDVTFTIESAGKVVYQIKLAPMSRTVGYGTGRRRISAAEHRANLSDFRDRFFGSSNFRSTSGFLDMLRDGLSGRIKEIPEVIAGWKSSDTTEARVIWEEMQKSPITVFDFSGGYDSVIAIGWSPRAKRFVQLLSCC